MYYIVKEEFMNDVIVRYVRHKDTRVPIGVVVATGKNKIGWARCHKLDSFSREKAKKIAIGRANCNRPVKAPKEKKSDAKNLAYGFQNVIEFVREKAERHFK